MKPSRLSSEVRRYRGRVPSCLCTAASLAESSWVGLARSRPSSLRTPVPLLIPLSADTRGCDAEIIIFDGSSIKHGPAQENVKLFSGKIEQSTYSSNDPPTTKPVSQDSCSDCLGPVISWCGKCEFIEEDDSGVRESWGEPGGHVQ